MFFIFDHKKDKNIKDFNITLLQINHKIYLQNLCKAPTKMLKKYMGTYLDIFRLCNQPRQSML